jgi:hypothetical protein
MDYFRFIADIHTSRLRKSGFLSSRFGTNGARYHLTTVLHLDNQESSVFINQRRVDIWSGVFDRKS